MADQALTVGGAGTGASAPLAYTIPGTGEIVLKGAFARLDGTSAAAPWVPCLRVKTPNGGIMLECVGSAVAAGASADVTWFPGVSETGGGGGGPTGEAQVRVPMITPDATSFAYPGLSTVNGFTNVRLLYPYLANGHDAAWEGSIPVPQNYKTAPQIILSFVANATTGVVRWIVGTAVVAAGASEDTAFTDETAQNITVPGTALFRSDVTFTIAGTTPTAGSTLNVRVKRNGANVADTCTAPAGIIECIFQYLVS